MGTAMYFAYSTCSMAIPRVPTFLQSVAATPPSVHTCAMDNIGPAGGKMAQDGWMDGGMERHLGS